MNSRKPPKHPKEEDEDLIEFEEIIRIAERFLPEDTTSICLPRPVLYDDVEMATRRICTRLTTGTHRDTMRDEMDVDNDDCSDEEDRQVKIISRTVGDDNWDELVRLFLQLPSAFTQRVKKPKDIIAAEEKITSLCHDLATALESHNPSLIRQDYATKFTGLIAKLTLTTNWILALKFLKHSCSPAAAKNIAQHCVYGLIMKDPTNFLVTLLRDYADALETREIDIKSDLLLQSQFTSGKLTFREYTKRFVFFFLNRAWPKQRVPNKETALIVNIILGLDGDQKVTANDISQMNKKTRRRYYTDT